RIEALSGSAAEKYVLNELRESKTLKEELKNPKDLIKAVKSITEENTALKKQLEKAEMAQIKSLGKSLAAKAQLVKGINFIGEIVDINSADALKKLAFEIKNQLDNAVITLASQADNKASIVLLIDDEIVK